MDVKMIWVFVIAMAMGLMGCVSGVQRADEPGAERKMSFVQSSVGLPTAGQWRQGLAFHDMNRDGNIDIIAPAPRLTTDEDRRPWVWLGDGTGGWSRTAPDVPQKIGYDYGDVGAGDFDGDGIADMALAIHGRGLVVLRGLGEGRYVNFSEGLPAQSNFCSRAIACGDFDGDGRAEIAAVSEAAFDRSYPRPAGLIICRLSEGKWECNPTWDEREMGGLFADQLCMGDINGDGIRDIGVASLVHVRTLIVWLGDGKGGFTPFNKGLPEGVHYPSVAFGDLNGDGKDDLVAFMSGFGTTAFKGLKAFVSTPDGFVDSSGGLPDSAHFFSVAAADLDGDGRAEIVGATGEGGVKIFSNQEGKGWKEVLTTGLPKEGFVRINNIYCVDVNRDDRKDIIFNHSDGATNKGGIQVFLNKAGQ